MAALPDLCAKKCISEPDPSPRRRRYCRQPQPLAALTPVKVRLLQYVASYRIVSLPQLALLAAASAKCVRRHLRDLFDAGFVEVVAVPRAALAEPGSANDASLLFGSAPNIYTPTKAGLRLLTEHGLIEAARPVPRYGPQNSLFLRHELAVRDVRVWLELAARTDTRHELAHWQDGEEAFMDLGERRIGSRMGPWGARPDAWFVLYLGERVLVGLVEYDRGTERGGRRWREKLTAYDALFTGPRLREITGYVNARVLVITPDVRRRDHLAEFVAADTPAGLAERFWLADRTVLTRPDLANPVWRRPGSGVLQPLVLCPVFPDQLRVEPPEERR